MEQTDQQLSECPFTLDDLKLKFKLARDVFDQDKLVPVLHLGSFQTFLEWAEADLEHTVYGQPDLKKFFFEEFVGGLSKRLSIIRDLEAEYLPMIRQIVMLLGSIFVKEIDRDNSDMADGIRYLFDTTCPLHFNLFQSQESYLAQESYDNKIGDRISNDERLWRQTLTIGSQVDAVKQENDYNLKIWSKAYVSDMHDADSSETGKNLLEITFENDSTKSRRILWWYSPDLDRYNTKSEGDEWRLNLKKDDLVDAYDNTRIWYASTIIDNLQRKDLDNPDGKDFLVYKVGFRTYSADGNKEDNLHRKFFGWSESFDEWIPASSPRLQKLGTYAKTFEDSHSQLGNQVYEESIDDQMDILMYQSKNVFAMVRKKSKSALLVGLLNRIGEMGAYTKILERLSIDGNDSLALETVFYYLDSFSKCSIHFNKGFLNEYLPALSVAVKKKILTSSEAIIKNIKKDRIDGIIQSLVGGLMSRLMSYRQREQEKNMMTLEIGCAFLSQYNFLERRIDGTKMIQEVCKAGNLLTYSGAQAADLASGMKNESIQQHQMQQIEQIIKTIKERDVLKQIFSRDRGHMQFVQRAEDLIKFLISQDSLDEEELELVWNATKLDENTQLEIYKIFNELASRLKLKQIDFIIDQLSAVPLSRVILVQIQLVHEIAKRAVSGDSHYGHRAIEYLWKIALPSEKIDKVLVNTAAVCLTDIIKNWDNNFKLPIIRIIVDSLKKNQDGYLCLKMLSAIFRDFTGKLISGDRKDPETAMEIDEGQSKMDDHFENKSTFIHYVDQEMNLMHHFTLNFQYYMIKARSGLRLKQEQEPQSELKAFSDYVLADRFCHSDQLTQRLEFLKYIACNSSVQVTKNELSIMWDELVALQMFTFDSDLFFRFLKEICDLYSQGYKVVQMDDLIQFFRENILAGDDSILQRITLEGYYCIQSFFVLTNEQSHKLERLNIESNQVTAAQATGTYPAQKFTSYSNTTGSIYQTYTFNQDKQGGSADTHVEEVEFHIHVAPWDLEGIEGIWKLVIETGSALVQLQATNFLIKLYNSVTFVLVKRIPEFENAFLKHCIQGIKDMQTLILVRTEKIKETYEVVSHPHAQLVSFSTTSIQKVLPVEEKRIIKYLNLVKELIKYSEKDGTRGVKSHAALFRGQYLDCLQIGNSLKSGVNSKYRPKFEIGVHANTTLFELRRLIGEQASRIYNKDETTYVQNQPVHPALIRIFRAVGCVDLKDIENGKTLAELRFKHNELLTAFRRSVFSAARVPLLNLDKTDLSERAKEIFSLWFIECSEPVDQADPESMRVMDAAHCKLFIKTATDEEVSASDANLLSMFETYDINRDGYLELEDFLQFWRTSIYEKEEIVRVNLATYGYRYDLKKQPVDGMDDYMMQIRQSKEDMPRYKIASTPEYFETLFDIIETTDNEVASAAWSLVRTAATNPVLYRKVIALDKDSSFQWSDIFNANNIQKMLYVLQIVEALLEESSYVQEFMSQHDQAALSEEDQLKSDWVQRFMMLGGFQEILTMFRKSLELISHKQADSLSKFEKSFLEQMLKLIKMFVLAAFSLDEEEGGVGDQVFEAIQLVKTASANQEVPANVAQEANQEEQKKDAKDTSYSTPAKQVKGKFVERFKARTVHFGTEDPEITQELLFGGRDQENEDAKENGDSSQLEATDKANAANQSPDDTKKRFSALAKIMRSCGLGTDILQKIDFADLQIEVLEVISLMLCKREIQADDAQIIENALGLWVATLIKNGNLINKFYAFKREANVPAYMLNVVRNANDLIAQGIHTFKNTKIKDEFVTSIICISQKVKNTEGQKPVLYFIDQLRQNYPKEEGYSLSRECKQFFDLFVALIGEYFSQLTLELGPGIPVLSKSEIEPFEILAEVIAKLKNHDCKETKGCILEDKTQIGYFQMIEKMVVLIKPHDLDKKLTEVIQSSGLIDEIFIGHLFYQNSYESSMSENKSKTKESRAAAYQSLQKVLEVLEPHSLADFLEHNLWPLVKDLERPKKWKFVPSDGQKGQYQTQFVGIVNLGCICYMNSMLQQFFMVPQFRFQLLKAIDTSNPDLKEHKGYVIDDSLLRQLQIMFANLELSERQAFYPLGFCFAYKDLDGNPTNTALQQDAQEFLNFFFGRLEDLLKPTSQKHLLEGVFGGKVCSQLICPSCGNIRNLLESYYNLSVQVKDRKGLDESLQKMIESSIINDFKCENCQQKVDVEKRQLIADPPNVLIVNLQRIIFNFDTFQNDKINTHFEFPNILNLKEYSFKSVMTSEGRDHNELYNETTSHLMDIPDDEYVYKLVGVTIHRGTAEHGHYYSLINTKRGKAEDDETKPDWQKTDKDPWRVFDDETVKHFNFSDLQQEAFGGQSSGGAMGDNDLSAYLFQSGQANSYGQNAYMLVYENMKKRPIKEVVLEEKKEEDVEMQEEATATLECVDTATSRGAQLEQTKDTQALQEFTDPKGEKYHLIPYRKVDPYVPDWIKDQVIADNNHFLIDRYIYHESFFNMIKSTLKHIADVQVRNIHIFSSGYWEQFHRLKHAALKVAAKVMFDMLAYYNLNTQLSDITSSLQTIFTFSDSQFTLNRGDPSLFMVFLEQVYLADDCQHFLKIMFDCTDKTTRFYAGRLTSILLNRIYTIYQDCLDSKQAPCDALQKLKETADSLLVKLVRALKSQECAKNWLKIEQYQKMIYDVAVAGKVQSHLLLSAFEIVPFLLDFILSNVSAKTSSKLSQFEHIVALVCYFTRFSLTPAMRAERHLWVSKGDDSACGILPPATLKGYEIAEMSDQEEKYPLSVKNFEYLLESELIEISLKEGVQTEELGKMIAHICYRYRKFSKKVAKMLLHGISRNDYEKIKSYLDVVSQIALVKDELQRSRLEWMFGFGSLISHTSQVPITNNQDEVLTKVGVKALHSLSDECFTFKSSLIQDTIDDALLHLLWRYKGRMDTYTVNCVHSLLNLIVQDETIAEYFADLPGPTYCLARYTDWFKPYLEKQLSDAKKGYSGTYSTTKEETVVKCLSLYDKYEAYVNAKDGKVGSQNNAVRVPEAMRMDIDHGDSQVREPSEENIKNLIGNGAFEEGANVAKYNEEQVTQDDASSAVIRCNPQPYIIVDCVDEKIVSNSDYGNVILQISALGCFYTESLPTGDSNLAIPKNLFKRTAANSIRPTITQIGTVNGNSLKNQAEQNLQAHCIKNYFQSSGLVQGTKGEGDCAAVNTTPRKKYKSDMLEQKEDQEERMCDYGEEANEAVLGQGSDLFIIKDEDNQWEKINRNESSDAQHQNSLDDASDSHEHGIIYKELGDGSNNQSETGYQIRVIEEGEEFQNNQQDTFMTTATAVADRNLSEAKDANDIDHTNEVETTQNNQNSIQEQEPDSQVAWPNELNYSEDLAYRIQVTNYREQTIECSLSFREDEPTSLFFPRGGFKSIVQPKSSKTIIVLHKLKVGESFGYEINKLTTNFRFSEKFNDRGQRSTMPAVKTYPLRMAAAQQTQGFTECKNQDSNEPDGNTSVHAIDNQSSNYSEDDQQEQFFDPDEAADVKIKLPKENEYKKQNQDNGTDAQLNEHADNGALDVKECPQCTFYNSLTTMSCEICEYSFN